MEEHINKLVNSVTDLFITPIIYLLVALSIMYFLWGLAISILNADDPNKRKEGRSHMLWGVIGLVIIVSVWGIINFVDNTVSSVL